MTGHALANQIKRHALQAAGSKAATQFGIVDAYNPNNYSAKVKLQPSGVITGWIPVLSIWTGNGWGLFCPPSPGDHVQIEYQRGDRNSPVLVLRAFNSQLQPIQTPNPVPSGEFWLVDKNGSFLKLMGDSSVRINSALDLDVTVGGNVNLTVVGNATITVTGTASIYAAAINLGKKAADTLLTLCTSLFATLYNGHTHASNGAPPTQQATSAHLTSIVKAE